jgi:hypothetical protein
VELGLVEVALRTQVVDEVVVVVLRVEELHHVVDVVAVDAFDVRGRVPHGDDVLRYVSQVQIEPVLFVSIPPLADQPPYRVGDVHVGERGGHRRRVRWSSRVGVIWDRQMPVQIVRAGRFM